MPNFYGELR